VTVLLLPLAVICLAVWLFVEAIDHVNKTGDIIFAVVAIVLAVAHIFVHWPVRGRP